MLYDDKKFIGQVIKKARQKAKLSQAELSEKIDMTDKNLGNIENGKQFPQVNNFLRLIEFLDLSLEDFGVKKKAYKDESKDALLKLILLSTKKECQAYLEILNVINNILINKN